MIDPSECDCEGRGCEDCRECECIQTDVDQFDARCCPAHGPHSYGAYRQRQHEADSEFAYYDTPGMDALAKKLGWDKY
jgi:hypothetical protein